MRVISSSVIGLNPSEPENAELYTSRSSGAIDSSSSLELNFLTQKPLRSLTFLATRLTFSDRPIVVSRYPE